MENSTTEMCIITVIITNSRHPHNLATVRRIITKHWNANLIATTPPQQQLTKKRICCFVVARFDVAYDSRLCRFHYVLAFVVTEFAYSIAWGTLQTKAQAIKNYGKVSCDNNNKSTKRTKLKLSLQQWNGKRSNKTHMKQYFKVFRNEKFYALYNRKQI